MANTSKDKTNRVTKANAGASVPPSHRAGHKKLRRKLREQRIDMITKEEKKRWTDNFNKGKSEGEAIAGKITDDVSKAVRKALKKK